MSERLRAAKDRLTHRGDSNPLTKEERAQRKAEAEARRMELRRGKSGGAGDGPAGRYGGGGPGL